MKTRDQYHPFLVGDVVSRDGTDEHLVYSVNDAGDLIGVVCIKEPSSQWTKLGETESNMARRYTFINKLLNYKEKMKEIISTYELDQYDKECLTSALDK